MTDRPASWRMPTPKQMEKLASAAAVRGNGPPARTPAPGTRCRRNTGSPSWMTLRNGPPSGRSLDPDAAAVRNTTASAAGRPAAAASRIVEIQKADAVRLAGAQAVWKDVGQRLLDDTCQQRTGRHEEDGCWPSFE